MRIRSVLMRTLLVAALTMSAAVLPVFPQDAAAADSAASDWLDIELGKSVVLETPRNATAISVTDPTVADVVPLASANKIQIQGVKVGSTDLVIQLGPGTAPIIYELTVHADLSDMIRRIDSIVEGEPPKVYPLGERIVVQGPVADLETLEQIAMVASVYDESFVNLMTVKGDHQVQLEVVFAEVSRGALRELGFNFLWGDGDLAASMVPPTQVSTANLTHPSATMLNGGTMLGTAAGFQPMVWLGQVGQYDVDLGMIMSILDDYRLGKILARPSLVCLSGQEAQFLAGGQVPLPAPGQGGIITITYKDYGVKLSFVPTVLGNQVIDLRVYIEVSEPDYGNGTRLTGIEIPGFITRSTQSHLRVDSGMTFAMAGLLNEDVAYSKSQVPVLGQLPIVGALFRYTRHERSETELVIYVTPRLVRPMSPGEIPPIPGARENNNPSDFELFLLGMDHRAGSRSSDEAATDSQSAGFVGMER